MVTKRTAMLAAGAAILVALGGSRMAGAADANWAADGNGHKPYDAVQGGTDTDKNPLFFCRAYQSDDYQPGVLNPTLKTCNFGSGGNEFTSAAYEVLVPHWAAASDGQVPVGSFQAGTILRFFACRCLGSLPDLQRQITLSFVSNRQRKASKRCVPINDSSNGAKWSETTQ